MEDTSFKIKSQKVLWWSIIRIIYKILKSLFKKTCHNYKKTLDPKSLFFFQKFKVQIQHELLEVIDSVSRRIIEEGDDIEIDPESDEESEIQETAGVTESARPLARLVAILADEFRACATRNKRY